MIYLPNSFERYLSALRLYVQDLALKNKNILHQLSVLKKIILAEALYSKEKNPLNIIRFSDSVLGTCVIILLQRGVYIKIVLIGEGLFLINRRIYTILLTELALNCTLKENIFKIKTTPTVLILTVRGCEKTEIALKLISALKGTFYYDKSNMKIIIKLPIKSTDTPSAKIDNEWRYILDRFSSVNVWLLNITDTDLL